eukprot:1091156-Prymnesium_polylepis.1
MPALRRLCLRGGGERSEEAAAAQRAAADDAQQPQRCHGARAHCKQRREISPPLLPEGGRLATYRSYARAKAIPITVEGIDPLEKEQGSGVRPAAAALPLWGESDHGRPSHTRCFVGLLRVLLYLFGNFVTPWSHLDINHPARLIRALCSKRTHAETVVPL